MAGALAIGLIGNGYSRLYGGTAFTAMATGVAFLVPSGIAGMGGLGTEGSADNSIAITFRIVKGWSLFILCSPLAQILISFSQF